MRTWPQKLVSCTKDNVGKHQKTGVWCSPWDVLQALLRIFEATG